MTELLSSRTEIESFLFGRDLSSQSWFLILAAVVIASLIFYHRERGLKMGLRISLVAARVIVLILVATALFEPTAAIKETREEKRSLAVLLDISQSMSIRDQRKRPEDIHEAAVALGFVSTSEKTQGAPQKLNLNSKQRNDIARATRLDLAKSLLSDSGAAVFNDLKKDLNVRYYAFGQTMAILGDGESEISEELKKIKAVGLRTSLAEAIKEVADSYKDDALSGIVILSDGIETGNREPEAVAHQLGVRNIPVYTLPVGIPDPDDVSIRNVIVQDVAFVGDTVPVKIQIRSKGYEKRSADCVIRFNGKEVASESVVLEGGLQYVDLSFDANIKTKRAVAMEVEMKPFGDEATSDNNKVIKSIRVVNEKINVLCIEGSARWEFRYLRAILKRDPRIRTKFIATRAGNDLALHSSDYIARFPEDPEEAFKYDLVILGDVNSEFFTPGEFSRLNELVKERGGSMLMLAGPKYSPSSYEGTVVEKMLPVRFNAQEKWRNVGKSIYPVLTPEGRSSLVLTLDNNKDKNDRLWTHVAPMDRLPPLLDARPGASVLAGLSDNGARAGVYPLISWQRYGTGKCMLMATDRLWRLRFRTGDKYHWRVWSQCIQFLTLSRLMGEHKQIRMETNRATYAVGEQVRVYAEVLDEGYEPVMQQKYDVFIGLVGEDEEAENNQGQRVSLKPDASRPGLYEGFYSPPGAGRYRIQAGEDDADFANTLEFQVAEVKPEMATTDMQIDRLERISELSGGKSLKLSEVALLKENVNTTQYKNVIRRELSLWDNWLFAMMIIALTGFEWIVRRRFDLL